MKIERLIGYFFCAVAERKGYGTEAGRKSLRYHQGRFTETLKIYARLGFPFVQFREVAEEFASWMAIGWTGHC